jgi:hypothetical protein
MKMSKLPFEYVESHVDKLYEKQFDEDDLKSIDNHCDFIREFINSCGWTEEEYIRSMMGFESLININ